MGLKWEEPESKKKLMKHLHSLAASKCYCFPQAIQISWNNFLTVFPSCLPWCISFPQKHTSPLHWLNRSLWSWGNWIISCFSAGKDLTPLASGVPTALWADEVTHTVKISYRRVTPCFVPARSLMYILQDFFFPYVWQSKESLVLQKAGKVDMRLNRTLTLLFPFNIKPFQDFLLDCFTTFTEKLKGIIKIPSP